MQTKHPKLAPVSGAPEKDNRPRCKANIGKSDSPEDYKPCGERMKPDPEDAYGYICRKHGEMH